MKHYQWILLFGFIMILTTACGASAARYNNRGNADYTEGNYDEAMEDYTQARQEDPNLPEPYYNGGNAQYRRDDLEKALAQLEQAKRTEDRELQQKVWYNLGNTYFRQEDWAAAVDAYRQSLLLKPDDVEAKHNLELALQKLQQQQQQQNQNQQQGGGGQGQQNNQDGQDNRQGGGQSDNNQEDQDNQGGGQQPDQNQSGGGSQPQDQPGGSGGGLSRAEAEQLLDALGQDGQTLQERLQQRVGPPAPRPDKDW